MKYKVGDLLLVKDIPPHPRPRLRLRLNNTFGIITAAEKHNDIFQKDSTENANGYVWYSQVDNTEYYFYEDEVVGEVVE